MTPNLTDTELMKLEYGRCLKDAEYFIRNYVYIFSVGKGRVKFDLYPFQADTLKSFLSKDYVCILKARQMGLSTLLAAYALWLMIFRSGSVIGAISLKTDVAKEYINKIRFANEALPDWLRLKCVEDNRLSITFANNSRFIANSTTEKGSVSYALSLFILDEAALVPNCQELWISSQPSLSNGGKAIILSTPRGNAGFFHDCYVGASNSTGKFFPIRLPWNLHPLHDQQWRDNEGAKMGSPKLAAREYDCDFMTSGDTLISTEILEEYRGECCEPLYKRNNIGLWIWERPVFGKKYYIGADVASGYAKDNSTAQIIDDTGIQVGELQHKLPVDEFGRLLVDLAKEYNNATLVIERSGIGEGTVRAVINEDYPLLVHCDNNVDTLLYSRDYRSKDVPAGFATTSANRPRVIIALEKFLRERRLKINSHRFISELDTFLCDDRGRYEAASSLYHDDLVMAMGMLLYCVDGIGRVMIKHDKADRACLASMTMTRAPEGVAYQRPAGQNPYGKNTNMGTKNPYESWRMKMGKETEDLTKWL